MKKILLIAAAVLFAAGCTTSKVTHNKDGSWGVSNTSFLMQRMNVRASVDTNGVASFSEDKMTPDQQTLSKAMDVLGILANKAP